MIVQHLAVQRSQWLSFICCYVIWEMEKIICPLPRLKFMLNSIKNVDVPVKPQRVISATTGLEYFARTVFEMFFPEISYETHRLFQRGGRVPKSFFFEKSRKTMSFFQSAFQSILLKHAGEIFLFCVMQTF